MGEEPTTRPPPAHGWFVLVRALFGLQVAATLVASTLFLWLAFDPKRDRFGLLAVWLCHGVALIGGALVGLAPSLLLDRRCAIRGSRRSRFSVVCVAVLVVELGVAGLLHWQAVC